MVNALWVLMLNFPFFFIVVVCDYLPLNPQKQIFCDLIFYISYQISIKRIYTVFYTLFCNYYVSFCFIFGGVQHSVHILNYVYISSSFSKKCSLRESLIIVTWFHKSCHMNIQMPTEVFNTYPKMLFFPNSLSLM